MKKEDFIALGLDEEMAKKCEKESEEELKGFVPYERFKEVNEEKKTLKETLTERDNQLETLKTSTGDVEALRKQIETLQGENKAKDEEHAAEIRNLKINSAIENAITGAKGKNAKAIKALLEMEKIDLDKDGNVIGIEEQMKALVKAEDSKFLFEDKPVMKGAKIGESGVEPMDKPVDLSKMTYDEISAYMANN